MNSWALVWASAVTLALVVLLGIVSIPLGRANPFYWCSSALSGLLVAGVCGMWADWSKR